ncbi:hypothetical protein VCSRO110_3651 [Vibrio cholerae]|nr:hypothetical protein VCSRO110_3651 [Vibrio cholerae]
MPTWATVMSNRALMVELFPEPVEPVIRIFSDALRRRDKLLSNLSFVVESNELRRMLVSRVENKSVVFIIVEPLSMLR